MKRKIELIFFILVPLPFIVFLIYVSSTNAALETIYVGNVVLGGNTTPVCNACGGSCTYSTMNTQNTAGYGCFEGNWGNGDWEECKFQFSPVNGNKNNIYGLKLYARGGDDGTCGDVNGIEFNDSQSIWNYDTSGWNAAAGFPFTDNGWSALTNFWSCSGKSNCSKYVQSGTPKVEWMMQDTSGGALQNQDGVEIDTFYLEVNYDNNAPSMSWSSTTFGTYTQGLAAESATLSVTDGESGLSNCKRFRKVNDTWYDDGWGFGDSSTCSIQGTVENTYIQCRFYCEDNVGNSANLYTTSGLGSGTLTDISDPASSSPTVDNPYFSPEVSAGVKDTATASMSPTDTTSGIDCYQMEVKDSTGASHIRYHTTGSCGGDSNYSSWSSNPTTWAWDGKDDVPAYVAEGTYRIYVKAEDKAGRFSPATGNTDTQYCNTETITYGTSVSGNCASTDTNNSVYRQVSEQDVAASENKVAISAQNNYGTVNSGTYVSTQVQDNVDWDWSEGCSWFSCYLDFNMTYNTDVPEGTITALKLQTRYKTDADNFELYWWNYDTSSWSDLNTSVLAGQSSYATFNYTLCSGAGNCNPWVSGSGNITMDWYDEQQSCCEDSDFYKIDYQHVEVDYNQRKLDVAYQFNTTVAKSSITSVEVRTDAYSGNEAMGIYKWNYTSSSWVSTGYTTPSTEPGTAQIIPVCSGSNCTDYVYDSGANRQVKIKYIDPTAKDGTVNTLSIDYQKAYINYGTSYVEVVVDKTNPSTTDDWTDNWTVASPVDVTLSASDNLSGVEYTEYCTDTTNSCTPSTSGTSVAVSCAAGSVCTQYVRYRSRDNAGNTETTQSKRVRQDRESPSTTDNWTDNWTNTSPVNITLTPSDGSGSGIQATYYCVDTANSCAPTTSGTSVAVSCAAGSVCTQYVRYYSKDNVNNNENVKSKQVRQDRESPAVTFNNPASASWQKANFNIDISDSDGSGSGVSTCEYMVESYNGSIWNTTRSWITRTACNSTTSQNITVGSGLQCQNEGTGDNGNGACRVTVRTTDAVGNTNTLSARQFKIDWTAPGVPAPSASYNNSGFGAVISWAQVTDGTSGLPTSPTVTYEIDRAVYSGSCGAYSNIASIATDSTPYDITAPAYYDSNGGAGLSEGTSYCWRVRATDVATNWSNYGVVSNITISDVTPPSVPTGLSGSPASTTQINLSWTASSGSPSKYNIYANATSSELNLISTIATGYADGGWYNLGGCPGTDTNIKVDDACYGTASVANPYISYYWGSAKTLGTVIARYFDTDDRIYYNTKLQYSTDTTNGQDGVWSDATQKQNYASRALQEYDLNGTANLKGIRVYFNANNTANAYKRIKYLETQPSWIAQSAGNSYNNTSLTANTQYYYKVDSCDAGGNCSASTSAINKWTYAVIPSATCTSPASCNTTTKYTTTGFSFQSSAGWGGGGVQYYRYVWDQNKNYNFAGSESTWSDNNAKCPGASCTTANTTLSLTATQKGSWYLHLKSYNGEDVSAASANSEITYGPYYYDDLTVWWYPASGSAPNASSFSAGGSIRQIGSKYHYYVVDTAGKLFTLNANDGTLDWSYDSASVAVSSSTPTSYGSFVYFGNGDGKLYKIKDNDTTYSTAQGDTGWATNPVLLGDGSDKSIKTTPMIVSISGSNRIIISAGEDLYCVNDSDGSLCSEWTTNPRNLPNSGSPEQITATPTLSNIGGADANYIFVATQKTSSAAQVYKINKGDGTINATFNTDVGGVEKNISLRYYTGTNLYLYFGGITANKFYVVDSSMTQVYCVGSGCAQDPTGLNSFYSGVYISPFGGAIYIGNNNGKVYKLQGSDGACLWYYNAGASILGTPVSWNSKVYFAASDGKFYVVTDTAQSGCALNNSTITSFPFATGDLVYSAPTFYLSDTKVIIPSTVGRIFAFNMP